MKTLVDHLAQYAAYHRDRRNIARHFIGIPMIVLSVAMLLSRPSVALFGLVLTPAVLVVVAMVIFYLALDLRFALVMAAGCFSSSGTTGKDANQPSSTI